MVADSARPVLTWPAVARRSSSATSGETFAQAGDIGDDMAHGSSFKIMLS